MTEFKNCHRVYSVPWMSFAACPEYRAAVDGMHLLQLAANMDGLLHE